MMPTAAQAWQGLQRLPGSVQLQVPEQAAWIVAWTPAAR